MRPFVLPTRHRVLGGLVLIALLIAAIVMLQLGQPLGLGGTIGIGAQKGQLAPDFSAKTADGQTVRLSDLHGKRIVLNFFGTWCAPCQKEAPELAAAARKHPDAIFVGLTWTDTLDAVRAFATRYDIPYILWLADSDAPARAFQVRGLPTTFFIRPDGVIHYRVSGPLTRELLDLELERSWP